MWANKIIIIFRSISEVLAKFLDISTNPSFPFYNSDITQKFLFFKLIAENE